MAISCEISCQNLKMSDACINNQAKRKAKEGDFLLSKKLYFANGVFSPNNIKCVLFCFQYFPSAFAD